MDGSMTPHRYLPKDLIGRRITGVARVFYEYRGLIEEGDGAVELTLDGEPILFEGDGDGERLRVREQAWIDPFEEPLSEENREFVEEHGRWRRVDCSGTKPYADLCAHKIIDACDLVNRFNRVAGVRISVSTASMWFVVDCDESYVFWAHPIGFTESYSRE